MLLRDDGVCVCVCVCVRAGAKRKEERWSRDIE